MAEWQTVMTEDEFEHWVGFYRDYPFDDFHRYHRPAAMVSVSLGGGKVEDKLEWLAPEPLPDGMTRADVNTLKAFGLTPPKRGD